MAYKDKSKKMEYQNAFIKQAYDRINLTVPKGQKEVIQAAAAGCGESVNSYIWKAIQERMDKEDATGGGFDISGGSVDGGRL